MFKTPVYIIADNIISSLGFDTAENIKQIRAEQTGIQKHERSEIYPEPFWASLVDNNRLSEKVAKINNNAAFTRLEQLFILSIQDSLAQTKIDIKSSRTLLIFATTKGNIDLLEHRNRGKFDEKRVALGEMAEQVSRFFENPNKPLVVCNACISGVLAMLVGARLLQQNQYDHIVVTGGDLVSEFTLSGFFAFKAVSDGPCKPYDKNRVGINLGEGCGTVILTKDKSLVTGKAVTLDGGGSSNDANHISGPSRTGDGLNFAIQRALKTSGYDSSEIHYLSMHGTATPYNDEMESKALDLAQLTQVPANSLKGYFGHTLGAAGIIESIVAIHSLKQNYLFRSLGFEELGVSKPLNIISETKPESLQRCLKTASGFGGCNAAIVLSKREEA